MLIVIMKYLIHFLLQPPSLLDDNGHGLSSLTDNGATPSFDNDDGEMDQTSDDETVASHETWTRQETLFLIQEMHVFITEQNELPQSVQELNRRIRLGKGKQKTLFTEIAKKLTNMFKVTFTFKQVSRKWQSLVDGFKQAIDNNNKTGRGRSKFGYLDEMNQLIGDKADVKFAVTATASTVNVHRPELVGPSADADLEASTSVHTSTDELAPDKTQNLERPRKKRRRTNDEMDSFLECFKQSEEAATKRELDLLDELKNLRTTISTKLDKLIDKM